jgi:hypothetical protein
MRRSQVNEILKILDDVFRQLGVEGGYAEAVTLVESGLAGTSSEQIVAVRIGMTLAEHLFRQQNLGDVPGGKMPTRDRLERELAEAPDLSNEDLDLLDTLKAMPRQFRKSMAVVSRQIQPKGGPPVKVPRSEYSKVCDQISSHVRSGFTLGQAKQRVAASYHCSVSMINTIWRSRSDRPAKTR